LWSYEIGDYFFEVECAAIKKLLLVVDLLAVEAPFVNDIIGVVQFEEDEVFNIGDG
jgi:hypothetical protein